MRLSLRGGRNILERFAGAAGAAVLASALAVFSSPAAAMTFQESPASDACGSRPCILASGLIDKHSVGEFDAFVRKNKPAPGATVALNSEGGVLIFGLELGQHIRQNGFSTTVPGSGFAPDAPPPGECASACVFTFMGGVQRSVGKGARVGVHQIYSDTQARDSLSVSDAQYLTSLVALQIDRMGGRLGILILALRTSPNNIHWFSATELSGLGVVTAARYVVALAN
ncbi:MAG: hypothetical protein JWO72_1077 [Caulobacteraceae bacterium]|nr:hypothetical protein [Caulobacteraceae bacterium]